jgi:thioredoxin-like negative regulator of GroEL
MEYKFVQSLEEAKELLREEEAVLVFFSDESCNVGDAISPKLQNMLKEEYPKMIFMEINTQMIPEARGYFNVFVIPTVLGYFAGQESIREARLISVPVLSQKIERIYQLLFG